MATIGRTVPVTLILGLLAAAACSSGHTRAAKTTAASPAAGNARNVAIHLIAYDPEALAVAAGTTVAWKQQDAGFHTVTSGTTKVGPSGSVRTRPDGTFRSGELATGKRFSFTFQNSGPYRYFCEIHPATMRGLIKVT